MVASCRNVSELSGVIAAGRRGVNPNWRTTNAARHSAKAKADANFRHFVCKEPAARMARFFSRNEPRRQTDEIAPGKRLGNSVRRVHVLEALEALQ